jgi:hypothetical protein
MNKLLATLGILILVVGFWVLVRDPGHIPLLDANRTILAETEAAGYCAAIAYDGNLPRPEGVKECLKGTTLSGEIDLVAAETGFCRGIYERYSYGVPTCLAFLRNNRLWPTMDATITNEWNRRFPYPGDTLVVSIEEDESRTGPRGGNERLVP